MHKCRVRMCSYSTLHLQFWHKWSTIHASHLWLVSCSVSLCLAPAGDWAGMHPAPPRPLAFQEQPSMSDRAAFSSSPLCCHMKETCLCLIRESFLLNKWVVCEGKNNTGLFQLSLGFTVHCSHIVEMFALPYTTHKGLCLCLFVGYYAVEVQLLSNLR